MGAFAVLWAPTRMLVRVAQEQSVLLAFGVVALYAVLQMASAVVDFSLGGMSTTLFDPRDFPGLPPELVRSFEQSAQIGFLVGAIIWPLVVLWVVVSLVMQLVTRFFGGTGPLSGMFAVVGVAMVPLVIAAVIELPLTGLIVALEPRSDAAFIVSLLSQLPYLVAYVWYVVLVVIGAAFARRISYGQSFGSCALSCVGCVGLVLVVAVLLAVLIGIIVAAANAAGAP